MEDSWPNGPGWRALAPGDVFDGPRHWVLTVVDCGKLKLPSGLLVVCDPFATMKRGDNPTIMVTPGEYPVRVTLAHLGGVGEGSEVRGAYASLTLGPEPEVERRPLGPRIPVRTGTACFVDDEALIAGMPDEADWLVDVFDRPGPDSWFARRDDAGHIGKGIANILLPRAKDGSNLVLFPAGRGDGPFPVVGGHAASGELVAVHVDFGVVPPD